MHEQIAKHAGLDTDLAHHHEHHDESSWAPMAVAFGAMFLLPLTFILQLVYNNPLAAIVTAGIGTPLVIAGISKWINECATIPPITKMHVSDVGIGVFIVGEIMIFLGLFASYWAMRLSYTGGGQEWPPAGTPEINHVIPLIMTVILVSSSLTYHYAEHLFEHGNLGGFRRWVLLSIVLGACFLGCTIYEYSHLIHEHFVPSTNLFSAAFYSLTGFHGSHVFVGLAAFVGVLLGSTWGKVHPKFVQVAGIYWHFVDVIWFFVASQVYFW